MREIRKGWNFAYAKVGFINYETQFGVGGMRLGWRAYSDAVGA